MIEESLLSKRLEETLQMWTDAGWVTNAAWSVDSWTKNPKRVVIHVAEEHQDAIKFAMDSMGFRHILHVSCKPKSDEIHIFYRRR